MKFNYLVFSFLFLFLFSLSFVNAEVKIPAFMNPSFEEPYYGSGWYFNPYLDPSEYMSIRCVTSVDGARCLNTNGWGQHSGLNYTGQGYNTPNGGGTLSFKIRNASSDFTHASYFYVDSYLNNFNVTNPIGTEDAVYAGIDICCDGNDASEPNDYEVNPDTGRRYYAGCDNPQNASTWYAPEILFKNGHDWTYDLSGYEGAYACVFVSDWNTNAWLELDGMYYVVGDDPQNITTIPSYNVYADSYSPTRIHFDDFLRDYDLFYYTILGSGEGYSSSQLDLDPQKWYSVNEPAGYYYLEPIPRTINFDSDYWLVFDPEILTGYPALEVYTNYPETYNLTMRVYLAQSTNFASSKTYIDVTLMPHGLGVSPNYTLPNITSATSDVFTNSTSFLEIFSGAFSAFFPDSDSLSTSSKYSFVFVTMFLATLCLMFAFWKFTGSFSGMAGTMTIAIDFLLFCFFVVIGYIPVAVVIFLLLLLIALAFFKLRGGS